MSRIHFTLQGKGGVGKTYVSSLIAQYLRSKNGRDLICVDTDPVNQSFASYGAFDVRKLELMEGSKVNERKFDELMELALTSSDAELVVDSGASSFIPFSNYLVENDAIDMLHAAGREVVVHPVITGGPALADTLHGFDQLASQFSEHARIIVWLNEFFGEVREGDKDFEATKVFSRHKGRVSGIIRIARQTSETFGKDVEVMLKAKLTFEEALASEKFQLMAKQRLTMVQKAIFNQVALVL